MRITRRRPKSKRHQARLPLTHLVIVSGIVCAAVYCLRWALLPFVLAGGVSLVGFRVAKWLEQHWRWPHLAAVVAVFVSFLILSAGLSYWIARTVTDDLSQALPRAPEHLHDLFRDLLGGERRLLLGKELSADQLADATTQHLQTLLSSHLLTIGAVLAATIPAVTLVIVLVFYFVHSGDKLAAGAIGLAPPERRAWLAQLISDIVPVLLDYIRGVFVVVALTAFLAWIWLSWILRLPHAVLLALLTGILELMPVIGPISAAVLVGIVAAGRGGLGALLLFGGYCAFLRLTIDQLVGPIVLGRAAKIHPVVVLFAFVVGGFFFGVLGLLLAVPVARCTAIVLDRYYRLRGATTK